VLVLGEDERTRRPTGRNQWDGEERDMSMHVEWDKASEAGASIYTREAAQEEFGADDISAPFVLVLGGNGGGALAVEGTRDELIKLGEDISAAARKL
jgi:hypothetical protein